MILNEKKMLPFIEFKITDKCNYRCEYCTQELRIEKEKNHLDINSSDDTINAFIKIIKALEGQWEIRLMGGEALIHPRFFELVESIASVGHNLYISTNFSFPIETYKKLADICGERLVGLYASLHLTQIKSFNEFLNKTIEFESYKNKKTDFVVVTVLTEENFETLKNLKEKFNNSNIKFSFQRLKIHEEIIEYSKEIENYLKQNPQHLAQRSKRLSDKNMFGTICNAGYKSFNILADGHVNRCFTPQGYLNELGYINQGTFKRLNKPMPCLAKKCCCCNVILDNNLIEHNHKNYLKAFYFYLLDKKKNINKSKSPLKFIKSKLHTIKLFISKSINGIK